MEKLFATLILAAASTAAPAIEIETGSVVCRTRAALEILRESGGFDRLPEHFRGITCFEVAKPLRGDLVSRDDTGVVEVRLTQRRTMSDPSRVYVDVSQPQNATRLAARG